ncbi:MAG: acetate/propionate family kinase [Aquificaceae bacterium]
MSTFLAINYGSSSLKFAIFKDEEPILRESLKVEDLEGFKEGIAYIRSRVNQEPTALAHRVVHGMDYSGPIRIDHDTLPILRKLAEINPLHNTVAFSCIRISLELFPTSLHYALFDTDFHKSLPEHARMYGVSLELYRKGVKRYGFHGLSYSYLLERAQELLDKEKPNLIIMHLGSGCSVCAVKEGRSVDTSMGFSPLEGLLMATRPGDLDAGVVLYLLKEGYTPEELERLLYYESGLMGLWGKRDFKDLLEVIERDTTARTLFDLFVYRLLKYVGAYWFVLEGSVDALVFSGGIGENSPQLRLALCERLKPFSVIIDQYRNQRQETLISTEESKVKVLVLKTDEELQMVRTLKKITISPPSS